MIAQIQTNPYFKNLFPNEVIKVHNKSSTSTAFLNEKQQKEKNMLNTRRVKDKYNDKDEVKNIS